jgi:hypothetical protein
MYAHCTVEGCEKTTYKPGRKCYQHERQTVMGESRKHTQLEAMMFLETPKEEAKRLYDHYNALWLKSQLPEDLIKRRQYWALLNKEEITKETLT